MNDTKPSGYDHRRQECIDLWEGGHSAPQISTLTGIPAYRVRILLKQGGVDLSDTRNRSGLTSKMREDIAQAQSEGATVREIAQRVDRPYATVLRWIRTTPELDMDSGRSKRHLYGDEAIRRFQGGENVKSIAKALGLVEATVSTWLKDEGFDTSRGIGKHKRTASKREQHLETVLRMHAEGALSSEISREVDVHQSTVDVWLRSEGKQPNTSFREQRQAKDEYAERRREALERYANGESITEIATSVGVSRSAVSRWIDNAGVRGQGGHYLRGKHDAEVAVSLYVEDYLPVTEVMTRMGKSHAQVTGWLKEAGVHIRSSWEQRSAESREAFARQGKTARLGRTPGQKTPEKLPETVGFSEAKTSRANKICAASDCDREVHNYQQKYCSPECRVKHQVKRQRDPENWLTRDCQNCRKSFQRPKSYTGSLKYCSIACSQRHTRTSQHVVAADGTVMDSWWEAALGGVLALRKITFQRNDRSQGVEWNGTDTWYSPDFHLPSLEMWVEVKGQIREVDSIKWKAFREQIGPLAVLDQESLEALLPMSRQEIIDHLSTLAKVG